LRDITEGYQGSTK